MSIQNHLDLLGRPVRDKVSGFTGTVTSICFDLFGCVQAVVAPSSEGHHGEQGAADKPAGRY